MFKVECWAYLNASLCVNMVAENSALKILPFLSPRPSNTKKISFLETKGNFFIYHPDLAFLTIAQAYLYVLICFLVVQYFCIYLFPTVLTKLHKHASNVLIRFLIILSVQRPLEQLADGEALLDLADVLVSSTKAENRDGPTPAEFVTAVLRNFSAKATPLDLLVESW